MTGPTVAERGWLVALAGTAAIPLATLGGSSCIIPDKGIVLSANCGARWCATAEFAEALAEEDDEIIQVQQAQPDGTTGWVTACICMNPADDLVLQSGAPQLQYELLRNQVLDSARQACLDAAIANGLEPDPPYPFDEQLEPSCYEAVTSIFRDGCCALLDTECGGVSSCLADPTGTGGGPGDAEGSTTDPGPDSADTTGADSSTGQMSSLEPFYAEVSCVERTCRIGQPLIDAMLSAPEAVLAEGTSLRFVREGDAVQGLVVEGVGRDTLAARLGLRDGDVLLDVEGLPLTTEAELLEVVTLAYEAEALSVRVRRDHAMISWRLVRQR